MKAVFRTGPGTPKSPFERYLVTHPMGDIIFSEGEIGTEMYIVQSGTVELLKEIGGETRVLSTLEKKKHLKVERDGLRYVYHPTVAREAARTKVLDHVIETFFGGSITLAVSAMLDERSGKLSSKERRELQKMLRNAKEDGR